MKTETELLVAAGVNERAAARLVENLGGTPAGTATVAELVAAGVPEKTAAKVAAALELGRGTLRASDSRQIAGRPEDIAAMIRPRMPQHQECFWVVAIDARNRVLDVVEVARGHVHGVEVQPREIFRPLLRLAAAGAVVAHNHPSGDPTPSTEDIELTRRIFAVGRVLGIPVVDHVVVAATSCASIAELHPSLLA